MPIAGQMKRKTCPMKGPNPEPRRVLANATNDAAESNACTGDECMFYVTFTENGRVVAGNCSFVMGAIALVNIEQRIAAMQQTNAVEPGTDSPIGETKPN